MLLICPFFFSCACQSLGNEIFFIKFCIFNINFYPQFLWIKLWITLFIPHKSALNKAFEVVV
jgi:hypothetical protein